MSFRGIERRRHPRCDFSDTIDYCINPSAMDETLHGLILNISESGLCLYTSNSLSVGQELIIKTTLKAPVVKATIRWVKRYRDDLFKIGAMFID
jgi:PilZ domain